MMISALLLLLRLYSEFINLFHTHTHIHELHRAPKLILVIACAELRAGLVVLVGYRCWDYCHLVFAKKFLLDLTPSGIDALSSESVIVETRTYCSNRSSDMKYWSFILRKGILSLVIWYNVSSYDMFSLRSSYNTMYSRVQLCLTSNNIAEFH